MSDFEELSKAIIDILEEQDDLRARTSMFDGVTPLNQIQSLFKARTGEVVPLDVLQAQVDYLWRQRDVVKVKGDGQVGYRSRVGEILRYLYKLKLWTIRGERQRIYEDVSQLKYVRIPKFTPARIRPVEQMSTVNPNSSFGPLFRTHLQNPYGIDPIEIIVAALKNSPYHFEKLSDFQMRSAETVAREWVKDRSNSIVITAPTGAGKTLAFLLSPLIFCVADLLRNPKQRGTVLMLVYPRNALALNQSQVIRDLAFQINQALQTKFREKGIGTAPPQLQEPLSDFGGMISAQGGRTRLEAAYQQPPEILITNMETLKRRMMDPIFKSVSVKLRCVIFDEIHIYEELHGTNVIYLIRRLKTIVKHRTRKDLLFVGSSATIAQPNLYGKTIFSSKEESIVLTPKENELFPSGKEHHVFLRPYLNRAPLSVAIDATSCVLHNDRKLGLVYNKQRSDVKDVEKALAFADSLDIVNRWHYMLQSNEKAYKLSKRFSPNYARYSLAWHTKNHCTDALGVDGVNSKCEVYRDGRLWVLMADSPDQNFVPVEGQNKYVKMDAAWPKRYTAKTAKSEQAGPSSNFQKYIFGFPKPPPNFADLVIATTALEVGVDFDNVKEIILYRALKSPASYRQRIGRAGREVGSTALMTTIVSQLPQELYFFRHFMSLVTPAFQPIPVKDVNIEVIRNHLFCALFDLAAAEGLNLWDLLNNPNLSADIEAAKKLAKSPDAELYLGSIYNDGQLIKDAANNFIFALDKMNSGEVFDWLGMKGSFTEFVSNIYRNRDSFKAVESSVAKREEQIREALDTIAQIQIKKTRCFDVLKELDSYPELRVELFSILSDLDRVIR